MQIYPNYSEEKDDIALGTGQGQEQEHTAVKCTRAFVFIINYRDRTLEKVFQLGSVAIAGRSLAIPQKTPQYQPLWRSFPPLLCEGVSLMMPEALKSLHF